MEIFKEIAPLRAHLRRLRQQGKSIGLVPTMGALHDGHLSIIRASKNHNDVTVCSIFVNPAQFNNPDDLLKYPRTFDQDTELLEKVDCDILFYPPTDEMYERKSTVSFDFGTMDKVMEGKFRPGHFSGVALVVSKLFNIVQPDHAYFGQKDWQQFTIIRCLTEELKFDIQLHNIPTFREPNGLAMSSRNLRLTAGERQKAAVFYQSLRLASEKLKNGTTFPEIKETVKKLIEQNEGIALEYLELADSKNLKLIDNVNAADKPIMCIAGYVGDVRLIDNMFVE